MLSRLVEAIQQREGEFKESEIYLLGPRAMVIASALANAAIEGQGPMFIHAYSTEAIEAYFDKKRDGT